MTLARSNIPALIVDTLKSLPDDFANKKNTWGQSFKKICKWNV